MKAILTSCLLLAGVLSPPAFAQSAAGIVGSAVTTRIVRPRLPQSSVPKSVQRLEAAYGEIAIVAYRRVGWRSLESLGKLPFELRETALLLLARKGQSIDWLVKREDLVRLVAQHEHKIAVVNVLTKHGDAASRPLVQQLGPSAVTMLEALSPTAGMSLARMATDNKVLMEVLKDPRVVEAVISHRANAIGVLKKILSDNKANVAAGVVVAALLSHPVIVSGPRDTRFTLRHDARSHSQKLVVFVHGLGGDERRTFGKWLDLMKDDRELVSGQVALSKYSIATLGYPASPADRFTITEIASKLTNDIDEWTRTGDFDEINFIGHSLGGIVIKRLLLNGAMLEKSFEKNSKSVFLIAVPSQGSPLASIFGRLARWIAGPLVKDLEPISMNAFLQQLQIDWRHYVNKRFASSRNKIFIFCAYEKQLTLGVDVVPLEYTDSECDGIPVPMNAGHTPIVQPVTRDASIYQWVRRQLVYVTSSD